MTNYLIMPKNVPEHYFFKNGIYLRRQTPSGLWQEATPVFSGGKDGFSVYCGNDGSVHIICTDLGGNLVYIVSAGEEWKKYVLSTLSGDISVTDMKLYSIRGRLNLLYSAIYNGENLLVHCILGDHAKPSSVDTLETPHFFIKSGKVYYTNTHGVFGFVSLADEKPSVFTPLYEDAHFGTVYDIGGKERILFSRNSAVFLDGAELARDTHLEMPIMVTAQKKRYVMWKSGGFVRYVSSDDGERFGKTMRFMNSGRSMQLYTVQRGAEFADYYGYDTQNGLVLLGNPDIFEVTSELSSPTELEKVRDMLNKTQQDITAAKKELARLGKLIGALGGKN